MVISPSNFPIKPNRVDKILFQAPTAPTKRPSARQRALARLSATGPAPPRKTHRPDSAVTDAFLRSKRDRRLIRHSAFVSRIAKTTDSSGEKRARRRRPSKKLVTTLQSLAAALPELEEDGDRPDGGKVRHRSLRSRPGALKRKERVVKGEMARFGASLAQLMTMKGGTGAAPNGSNGAGDRTARDKKAEDMEVESGMAGKDVGGGKETEAGSTAQSASAAASRWAALRGFISATMEQNPAFVGKG